MITANVDMDLKNHYSRLFDQDPIAAIDLVNNKAKFNPKSPDIIRYSQRN